MFDIILNFAGIFSGCFNRRRHKIVSLDTLKANIQTMSQEMKVRYILQKILNDTYDVLFLNSIDRQIQKNVLSLGEYDHMKTAFFSGAVLIPIFIENELKYFLVLCNYNTSIKTYNKELVKLLTEILGNSVSLRTRLKASEYLGNEIKQN